MLKNEDDSSNIRKEKKLLEEKEECLFIWKRQEITHYNQMLQDFRGEDTSQDRRSFAVELDHIERIARQTDVQLEEEAAELKDKQKHNSNQRDSIEAEYKSAQKDLD